MSEKGKDTASSKSADTDTAAAKADVVEKDYVAASPILHNGKRTEIGEPFKCDGAEMQRLIDCGALRRAD